jgi:phosphoesterase RecJ-like protein
MNKQEKILKKEVQKAKNILLLTHKGPDLDAFCSVLLTYKILRDMFPKKSITVKTRQYPMFKLPQMENITLVEEIDKGDEDLIICTDSSEWKLVVDEKRDGISNSKVRKIFIDHHRTDSTEDVVINEFRSSATEQVYVTFKRIFEKKFKIDQDIASLVQYGIVDDTGRFLYDITTPETMRVFAEVMEFHRVDLEEFTYKSKKFPKDATDAVVEFLKTLKIEGDMAYMYMPKEIVDEKGLSKQGVNTAQAFLRDSYLRFIQGVHWGFIVGPSYDYINKWYVSFRSTKGYQDVEVIAKKLNGGGHKYSSAAKITADTAEEVVEKVLSVVKEVVSS